MVSSLASGKSELQSTESIPVRLLVKTWTLAANRRLNGESENFTSNHSNGTVNKRQYESCLYELLMYALKDLC